jgi:hypothetical protein
MIDITTTAVIRPKIFNETLSSFRKLIFSDKYSYRLILNVDPIGEKVQQNEMYKIAKKFFNNVVVNYPTEPGFTKAVIWCWKQVESDYVFHLEDDWRLICPISLKSMVKILDHNSTLVSLRLNKLNIKPQIVKGVDFIYCPKLSLNPTLLKGKFIKGVVPLMVENLNPEKQLRTYFNNERSDYISKFRYGIYVKDSCKRTVIDIGRIWMRNSEYQKRTGFLEWKLKGELKNKK